MYWYTHFCYFQSPTVDCRACIANVGDARLRWSRLMILSERWRWNSDIFCTIVSTMLSDTDAECEQFWLTQSFEWHFLHRFHRLTTLIIHHPITLSFQAQNLPFLQILPTASLPFLLQDWLHGSRTVYNTGTSEHVLRSIGKQFFSFSVFHFLVIGSMW